MGKTVVKKLFWLGGTLLLAVLSLLIDASFVEINLEKLTTSLFLLAFLYLILRIVLEVTLRRSIDYSRTRYSLRKVLRMSFYGASFLLLVTIWVEDTESLLVTYGLFSAGVALAIQDTLRNFLGGITVYLGNLYSVGDRIEIDGVIGDVLDINFNYTTLMELNNWVAGDQPTGRIIYIPNQKVSTQEVINFSKDHKFMWDEVSLPLTYDSDWRKARELILTYLSEEMADIVKDANDQLAQMGRRYYLEQRAVNPTVFIEPTDNWIDLRIRYLSNIFERRETANNIRRKILEIIESEQGINIASQTYRVFNVQE